MTHKTLLFVLGALALVGCDSPTAPATARVETIAVGWPFPPRLLPQERIVFMSDRAGDPATMRSTP